MHEQDNVAVIQKLYAAFGSGDIQTILDTVAANAEWVNYGPSTIPYAGNFTGQIAAFFQAIGESTTDAKVVPDRFIAQGDSVLSIGRYIATVRSTHARIETPVAHLFTVKNGTVTSWVGFSDSAAVAAAHTGTAASASR
jgi:ketosteroid isomerase-like protein